MKNITKLTFSGFFLALSLVLPFLTGQIPEIGSALLPMHIPILICGFICGWKYGLLVGFTAPLLRNLLFAMPPMTTAIPMAFELAAYGAVTGILYHKLPKSKSAIYFNLLLAMIAGRAIWGAVSLIICGLGGTPFTWQMFIGGALLNALPGIILQIVLIPLLMMALEKTGVMNYDDQYFTKTHCTLSKDADKRCC